MTKVALFVKHKIQPGKRDDVRKVWGCHIRPSIASNPGHEAYFHCYDDNDPNSLCAFHQYTDLKASQDFLKTDSYVKATNRAY